jgi:hypothetical protein
MSSTGGDSTSATVWPVLERRGSGAFPGGGAQASAGARLEKELQRRRD